MYFLQSIQIFIYTTLTGIQNVKILDQDWSPSYFTVILSGVILALLFQFLLTALSIALGLSVTGDLKEKYVKNKNHTRDSDDSNDDHTYDQEYDTGTNTGVVISNAFGVWSLLTTFISLFGATYIAVHMNLIAIEPTNIATGLVIWALFFIILFYLEAKIANSLIGGLISASLSGIRGISSGIKSMVTPNEADKMNKVVESTINKVKSEFGDSFNLDTVNDTISNFFQKAENAIPNYERVIDDLKDVASESKSTTSNNMAKWVAAQQIISKSIDKFGNSSNSGVLSKINDLSKRIKKEYDSSLPAKQNLINVITEFTDKDKEEIQQKFEEFQNYLSIGNKDKFTFDSLNSTITSLFNDPKIAKMVSENNLDELSRERITQLLVENTNLDQNEINMYIDRVLSQIDSLKMAYYEKTNGGLIKGIESKLDRFLSDTGKDELDYSDLKRDLSAILNDPKQSLEIIRNRYNQMDSDTLKALITNNKYISESHIDKVTSQIDSLKHEALTKYDKYNKEVNRRIENIKRKAVINAEHTRKTAENAAWWLVVTISVSSVGAMLGSSLVF